MSSTARAMPAMAADARSGRPHPRVRTPFAQLRIDA
jgi:hypothetical protein